MGRHSPFTVVLGGEDRDTLVVWARGQSVEHRLVLRARIVLLAAEGMANKEIAARLGVVPNTVLKWRKRFWEEGMEGLADRPRSGRRKVFGAAVVTVAKAIACELPATRAVPLSRYSATEVARQLVIERTVETISPSTVARWLAEDALRPWRYRSWIFPRDPRFSEKAGVVLDLYDRRFEGRALGPDEFVVSADEKTSIQARCRCHPTLPAGRGEARRVEHEYERRGALAYLAAWDVHRGMLMGRCEEKTGIEPFHRLVDQVMSTEPYASASRVFWVVDNGSSHRGQRSVERLAGEWPSLCLIHLPVHASWLNQIEIVFSILQRKVLTPNDFADLDALAARLAAFEVRLNATARPFDWRFRRADLDRLIARLEPAPAKAA